MTDTLIQVQDLKKIYVMGKTEVGALRGVSFGIERGELLSIIGPSGSGKSTLMNILGFLDSPSDGKYYFKGKDVSSIDEDESAQIRNKEIGFVFQNYNLLPRAQAFHNVELPLIYSGIPKKEREKRVDELFGQMDLKERMHHKPTELSGGQQQRVAIARALANSPSLILADEPTGNLDSKTGKEVMDLLTELNKEGTTVVMVTHSQHDSSYASRTIDLFDGEIVTDVKAFL